MLFLIQVVLATLCPPLQLFGSNTWRDFLVFEVFTPLGIAMPANHLLAGVLTYFKQIIVYLSILWYFVILREKILGNSSPAHERTRFKRQLTRRSNWRPVWQPTLLVVIVFVICFVRYFIQNGGEEAISGPVGKGLISGFARFIEFPSQNIKYLSISLYRAVEIGTYLILGSIAAATIPMFFKVGQRSKQQAKFFAKSAIDDDQKQDASITAILHRSVFIVPIVLIFFLSLLSQRVNVGEFSWSRPYVIMILLVLFALMYRLGKEVWDATSVLPRQRRLGKFVREIFHKPIVFLGVGAGLVSWLVSTQLNGLYSPMSLARTVESETINKFGEIFGWRLDIRESFRKEVKLLTVKKDITSDLFQKDCYPLKLIDLKKTPHKQENMLRRTCLQKQISIQYALDQIPRLLGNQWIGKIKEFRDRIEGDKHKAYIDQYQLAKEIAELPNLGQLPFFRKTSLLAISGLLDTKWVILNKVGLRSYRDIRRPLMQSFNQSVRGVL